MSESGSASNGNQATMTNGGGNAGTGASEQNGQGIGDQGQAQQAAGQVQEQAIHLMDMARGQVTSQLAAQKDAAAGGLKTLADILRSTGSQIREQDQANVAGYVDSAADRVASLAETLRTQNVDQLVTTTSQFARREPALFLASAFALGFAGMRFFRSSPPPANAGGNSGASAYPPPTGQSGFGAASYNSGYQSGMTGSSGAYDSLNTYDNNPTAYDTVLDSDISGSADGQGTTFGATWDPMIDPVENAEPR